MMKPCFSLATLAAATTFAFGQGSLTPPAGAPGPVMKTLDQVEARRPLVAGQTGVSVDGNGTFTISQSGSYYLTSNITISTVGAHGINVTGSHVTLDLNGYSLICTSVNGGNAVNLSGVSNVRIMNGKIVGGTTWSGVVFTPAGWEHGVMTSIQSPGLVAADVSVIGVRSNGISLNDQASRIERCSSEITGNSGLTACVVIDSTAMKAGGSAILAPGSVPTVVNNCIGETVGSFTVGISAPTGLVQNSQGVAVTSSGLIATTALNCSGTSSSGIGLGAESATNCKGYSATNNGVDADYVTNCHGISAGGSGRGIFATLATNCYGQSVGNYAIDVGNGTASYCRGVRSGGGVAIYSAIAIGCTVNVGNTVTATNSKHLGTL